MEVDQNIKDENNRQYGIIDQMLTMHSSYRDRMERRAFLLNTFLVAISLFLSVLSFISDNLLSLLNFDPVMVRFLLGLLSVIILVISITEFRVDWRSTAGRHAEAVSRLGALKLKYRKTFAQTGINGTNKLSRLTSEYEKTLSSIPPIPEKWFNKLKAAHQFKRIYSERISQCPKVPTWFLYLQLRVEGICESLHKIKDK